MGSSGNGPLRAKNHTCEFVKSIGIKGIKSSAHPGRQNLVLFNEEMVPVAGQLATYEIIGAEYAIRANTTGK
jgi:hypothetical protein